MAQNLCGYAREEIVKMLCTIQEICGNNCCEDCPFGKGNGDCGFHEGGCPADWNCTSENTWRALV